MKYKPSDAVDFLIIGAGAAGGVMAKELATAGARVLVLEQGPYLRENDYSHDEIKYTVQPGLTNDPKTQPNLYRKTDKDPFRQMKAIEYGRQVGGGTVHFTANYWRFHESDFHERSLYGEIPGTGFADWPIRYADLEPYYTKAEYDLGISGQAGANPFEAPRSKPYPLPPMPVKGSGVIFERAAKKLGLHPFPAPVAILSQPYQGRPACTHCGFCESFGCETRSKSSTLVTVIPMAEKTGRCEIRPNSVVRKIQVDANGRATGAVYFNAAKKEVFQRAKTVIVCANGVETPRLLLMSKSARFPQGLANSSGLVGKYLMWDNGAFASGLFEHPLNDYKGIQVTRLIHDYYRNDPKRGFYGGAGVDARFDFYPASFALYGLPPDAPRWGSEYKKMLREYFTRTMSLLAHATSIPMERNTITLSPEVKDSWGLPAVQVTYDFHPDDLANMRWILQRQVEILEAAGAKKVWTLPVEEFSMSRHLMGTCRMGDDPKTSVVDRNSRTHDVPNLYLVDGSNFVTCARQQPTATIQALAYRASDIIIRNAGLRPAIGYATKPYNKPMRAAIALIFALDLYAQGVNFYDLEKEKALGQQLAKEFRTHTTPFDSPTALARIHEIAARLAPQTQYTFALITDDATALHEPPAFPGGFIFVPATLILAAQTEDEFAGLLAHTIAHIVARHGTKPPTRQQLADQATIPLIFMGGWTGYAVPKNNAAAIPLGFVKYQRDFELQADTLATQMMSAAGYDPEALARYIEREQSPDDPQPRIYSPLPQRSERVAAIRALVTDRVYPAHPGFTEIQDEIRRRLPR